MGRATKIFSDCASQYREDLWARQTYRPEVWIEKDALVGVIEGVCEEFRVPYFSRQRQRQRDVRRRQTLRDRSRPTRTAIARVWRACLKRGVDHSAGCREQKES